mgnify:CR=1 FL=1
MVELLEYDATVKQQQQQMLEEGWNGGESTFDEAMVFIAFRFIGD